MERTHLQLLGASIADNEQTHNGRHWAVDELEEQDSCLTNV